MPALGCRSSVSSRSRWLFSPAVSTPAHRRASRRPPLCITLIPEHTLDQQRKTTSSHLIKCTCRPVSPVRSHARLLEIYLLPAADANTFSAHVSPSCPPNARTHRRPTPRHDPLCCVTTHAARSPTTVHRLHHTHALAASGIVSRSRSSYTSTNPACSPYSHPQAAWAPLAHSIKPVHTVHPPSTTSLHLAISS